MKKKTIIFNKKNIISCKEVPFYKIILEDSDETAIFFKARARYKPDKKVRRNLKALKEKLHFLSDN